MNMADRRIISIFKSFVEKIFVPHLSKMDQSCQQQWNKLSSMISIDHVNIGELQLYVDTLPTVHNRYGSSDRSSKSPMYGKGRKESVTNKGNDSMGFNPSKTFGGARSKPPIFPLHEFNDTEKKEPSYRKDLMMTEEKPDKFISTQNILPTLEHLYRTFTENQEKIERINFHPHNFNEQKAYYT